MNRRDFALGSAALVATVPLAGCTEEILKEAEAKPPPIEDRYDEGFVNLPVREATEVAEAGIEDTGDAEVDGVEAFETLLTDRDVGVEAIEEVEVDGEPVLSLEYVEDRSEERGTIYALGVVAGGYARLVHAGHDAEKLEATVLDPGGRPFGHFEVDTSLAEEYNEGVITAAEYARHVNEEFETDER